MPNKPDHKPKLLTTAATLTALILGGNLLPSTAAQPPALPATPTPMHQPLTGYTKGTSLFERLDAERPPHYHSTNTGAALLREVNDHFNASITYTSEPAGADHWQTPTETDRLRTGDCEDFAIAKAAALLQNGIPESSIDYYQGSTRTGGEMHFILRVTLGGNTYYLDNMTSSITENPLNTNGLTFAFNRRGLTYYLVPTDSDFQPRSEKH